MTFWILALLMLVFAAASIAVPLLRKRSSAADAIGYDRELYKARLAEIDVDLKLGRIGEQEAEAAKVEEGRKLISLSITATPSDTKTPVSPMLLSGLAAIFLLIMSVGLYLFTGAPGAPDMDIASRLKEDPSGQSVEQLLQRAEAQLARNPEDGRGWAVIAPVYLRLGRVEDAVTAFRNASRLDPENVTLLTGLGEAMVVAQQGIVTEEALANFEAALVHSPGDAKARFFVAIALGQQGDNDNAVKAWRSLIADAPAEAPWLPVAKAQLARLEGGVVASPAQPGETSQPGPSASDIEVASQMSPEDRSAMIETMIANLAEKLKDNPGDKEGWRRLIRSYMVLGKQQEAADALAGAKSAHAQDEAFLAELQAMVDAVAGGKGVQ
ncbi:MAG: c-type cytochrome biogenesis protein CcmI [Rhizobiaceae bacterium]